MSDVKRRKLATGVSEKKKAPVQEPRGSARAATPEEKEASSEEESVTLDVPSEDKSGDSDTPKKTFADLVTTSQFPSLSRAAQTSSDNRSG